MATSKVTSKGQVTIPLDVRRRLGIDSGDRIEFVDLGDGGFAIKPAVEDVRSLKGMLKKPAHPVTTGRMREAIRQRGAGK
jgi:AbrB family looped-hinge helix DNA binding protein